MDNCYEEILAYKSIAGRYRPVRVADGPITARCRFRSVYHSSFVNSRPKNISNFGEKLALAKKHAFPTGVLT